LLTDLVTPTPTADELPGRLIDVLVTAAAITARPSRQPSVPFRTSTRPDPAGAYAR
jgi:hypothetical protein